MGKMDAAYRRLFQHKALLRDLMACVLCAELFYSLDWDRMRAVPTTHVSDGLKQRTGDCAWLIPRKEPSSTGRAAADHKPAPPGGASTALAPRPLPGRAPPQGLCILLLLEPQSRPDDTMPLRMVCYAGLTYQTLINNRGIDLPLPPVLPVVLYSGGRRWTAAQDFAALLGDIPQALLPYQPQMRYLLINEHELMRHAGLPGRNLAVLLFGLNRSRDIEQWRGLLHTLIQAVGEHPGHAELNRSMTIWLQYMAQRNAPPTEVLPSVNTLQELDMMIAEKPGLWAREWLREGRAEGRTEGQADLLLGQIERRFGPVPDEAAERIRTADATQLKAWSLNFVDASTLGDVFRT